MSPFTRLAPLILAVLLPGLLSGQDGPPPNLAPAELDRSRECVPALALLESVEGQLEPYFQRTDRLELLAEAVMMEDPARAAPFDQANPVDVAVQEWFALDSELAASYLEDGDEAIAERRREELGRIQNRLMEAFQEVSEEVQDVIAGTEGLVEARWRCGGAILVRPAVLEACENTASPVCDAARSEEPTEHFRFVDSPELLWDIERMQPWSAPQRLHPSAEGGLAGARTAVTLTRGNVALAVSLETIIHPRSELSQEEIAEFNERLDGLGFAFGHPEFVMAPALSVRLEIPMPLADEDAYFLHFGDLPDSVDEIIRAIPTSEVGSVEVTFVATEAVLARLGAGEVLQLTAVRLSDPEADDPDFEALYELELHAIGQAQAISELVTYWAAGRFSDDLEILIPPESPLE